MDLDMSVGESAEQPEQVCVSNCSNKQHKLRSSTKSPKRILHHPEDQLFALIHWSFLSTFVFLCNMAYFEHIVHHHFVHHIVHHLIFSSICSVYIDRHIRV